MARNDLAVWLRSPAAIAAALLPALGMGVLVAVLTQSVGCVASSSSSVSRCSAATRIRRVP